MPTMTDRYRVSIALLGFLCLMTGFACTSAEDPPADSLVTDVVRLSESSVTESSGLAASWRTVNHFWTHNDSGGQPRLFAFDSQGQATGKVELQGVKASHWEDMASYVDNGIPRLLVADCGDNQRRLNTITWTINVTVWNSTKSRKMFNRLVCWTIFTQTNRVMSHNMNNLCSH